MTGKTRARSSSLFLLELIIAILFFAAASTVCVQIFVKSHNLSADAQCLNVMVNECSSVAEVVYASDSREDAVASITALYPDSVASHAGADDEISFFYDADLSPCAETDAVYIVSTVIGTENGLIRALITSAAYAADSNATDNDSYVSGQEDVIYSLEAEHALGREVAR